MVSQWYYGRGSDISGPASGQELSDLANSGQLLRSDTVWQEGVEEGVKAGTMENLFAPLNAANEVAVAAPESVPVKPPTVSRARATAGKGTTIIGQDGKNVKYQMKCTTCGYQDTSWKSIAIPRGTTRSSFYCQKCRKKRDTEIHGMH